jgi:hypothetical protein
MKFEISRCFGFHELLPKISAERFSGYKNQKERRVGYMQHVMHPGSLAPIFGQMGYY